jgi:hypothetical protein
MAKILHQGEWYEQLSTQALYENDYERLIFENSKEIFPNHILVPFKMAVESEFGKSKADFALIHIKYKDWWVVEAEMSHHSFENHVRPQIHTLSQAVYDENVAQYLVKKNPCLDLNKMCSVIRGQQPRVMVVVNAPVKMWADELKRYNAIVTIFEVFRSRHNSYLYRLNGAHLTEDTILRSGCNVDISRFLRILCPGILPIKHGEQMPIYFKDGITEWSRLDLKDRVYLLNKKPVSLNPKAAYELIERESTGFELLEKI